MVDTSAEKKEQAVTLTEPVIDELPELRKNLIHSQSSGYLNPYNTIKILGLRKQPIGKSAQTK